MDTDTQVLEPAVIEPAVIEPAVIEPAVIEPSVIEPATTETIEPVVAEPVDPIMATNSNPGSSSNTSNGNQVAVNSNFDYSTHHLNIYNYSYSSNTTTNQESLTTQMGQASGTLQEQDGFNCGVMTTRLTRSYRFDSREYFRGSGRLSRVDRIINFSGAEGDSLELSRRIFKGIGELDFVAVGNAKASKRAARSDNDIIYETSTGKLYFNSNDSDLGFGKQGGLFAIMEASPLISRNDFVIF
jgi:hypothetical protein